MNVKPANSTITVDAQRYRALLEDHADQSIQIKRLEATLQEEYNFAEQKMQENAKLNDSLERVTHFLESKGLVEEYAEYNKLMDSAPVEATEVEAEMV